jgi:hypothetical protein
VEVSSMMDQDRERQYNPFAPAMSNSGGAMDAGIPQIQAAQAAAMADQGESAKEKAIGLAMDKGMNYGVDKGAGALSKAIAGIGSGGSAASTAAMAGRAGLTGAGPGLASAATAGAGKGAAGAAGAAGGAGMAGMAAAAAPVLPFVIGAMALKSIFKK